MSRSTRTGTPPSLIRRARRVLASLQGLAKRWPATIVLGAVMAASLPVLPAAGAFVYDLSSRLIAITTAFVGTQVLLYGASPQAGSEIAVVVRGPPRDTTIRRKTQVGPIWINTQAIEFRGAPSFYAVAASLPLAELAAPSVLARHELGAEHLRLTPQETEGFSESEIASFRNALVRVHQRAGLYSSEPGSVSFLGDTLFRTRVTFPANVPPGIYQVQVLQFTEGEVVGAQTSTLEVAKTGIEAALYDLALHRAALYGLLSILIAVVAGWGANAMFRKP